MSTYIGSGIQDCKCRVQSFKVSRNTKICQCQMFYFFRSKDILTALDVLDWETGVAHLHSGNTLCVIYNGSKFITVQHVSCSFSYYLQYCENSWKAVTFSLLHTYNSKLVHALCWSSYSFLQLQNCKQLKNCFMMIITQEQTQISNCQPCRDIQCVKQWHRQFVENSGILK